MAGKALTIVVTGSNRGLGSAICSTLISSSHRINLYATSRQGVHLDLTPSLPSAIHYPRLDISDQKSIDDLVYLVKEGGGCDVLINNSGTHPGAKRTVEAARHTVDVNYRGTKAMCLSFLPIMKHSGRIINISSLASDLSRYSSTIQSRFRDAKTLSDIDALADHYLNHAENGTTTEAGFAHRTSYDISKALVNSLTAVLASGNPALLINSCCPGWVSTDMGKILGKPPKTLLEGARIPTRLALAPLKESGKYWANDGMGDKGDGRVQEW